MDMTMGLKQIKEQIRKTEQDKKRSDEMRKLKPICFLSAALVFMYE